jgi:hypothetical protein
MVRLALRRPRGEPLSDDLGKQPSAEKESKNRTGDPDREPQRPGAHLAEHPADRERHHAPSDEPSAEPPGPPPPLEPSQEAGHLATRSLNFAAVGSYSKSSLDRLLRHTPLAAYRGGRPAALVLAPFSRRASPLPMSAATRLRPAQDVEAVYVLGYGVQYRGRRRVHRADDAMAWITADRLIEAMERAGPGRVETIAGGADAGVLWLLREHAGRPKLVDAGYGNSIWHPDALIGENVDAIGKWSR